MTFVVQHNLFGSLIENSIFWYYRKQIKNVNAAFKLEHLHFPKKYCVTVSEPAFLTDVDLRRADKQMLLSVAGLHNLFHLELDISFLRLDYLFRPPSEYILKLTSYSITLAMITQ